MEWPRFTSQTHFGGLPWAIPKMRGMRGAIAWQASHPSANFVTTEEILSEVLTWFAGSGPAGRALASAMVRDILSDPTTQVSPQTSADFGAALALYEARPDKGYSLTDCRSMLAMRTLAISEALSNDHHFTQEGFTILFL